MIIDGDADNIAEHHFMYKGTMKDVLASFEAEKNSAHK
jgi:hypothetical protein